MDKRLRFTSLVSIGFVLLLLSNSVFAQRFYTSHNLWYENSKKVFSINYKLGKILPAGTEVFDVKIKKGKTDLLGFKVSSSGQQFIIYYQPKYHGKVSVEAYKNTLISTKSFDELAADLTTVEKEAILSGKILPGMSKKAVAIALGIPPQHKTPSLQGNQWLYWRNRFKKVAVNFSADGKALPAGSKPARQTTRTDNRLAAKPQLNVSNNVSNMDNVDLEPPSIVITEPAVTRGMRMSGKKIVVRGIAKDQSGVFEVLVNGAEAHLLADGSFWAEVLLAVGENQVRVRARDTRNNATDESFTIIREGGDAAVPGVVAQSSNAVSLGSGKYYALIIAVQDYSSKAINDLDEPIEDGQLLKNILTTKYTFDPQNIVLLENPSRSLIIENFDNLSRKISKHDNLLIFYAGHGYWDEKFQQGYWLPSDATKKSRTKWISNSTIVDFIRGIETTHTLLITDACFSGGIFKTRKAFSDAPPAVTELYKLPSRKAMTSGTLKEVPDKSVFVEYLTKRLDANPERFLSSEQLFTSFRTAVINNSPVNQIPQFGEIRQSGDEGGDFIFIKR